MTKNTRLLLQQCYPSAAPRVNATQRGAAVRTGAYAILLAVATGGVPAGASGPGDPLDAADCRPVLTARFAPAPPGPPGEAGRFRVCRSSAPLDAVNRQFGTTPWPVESRGVAEAFAGAPPEIRRRLGLAYGGRLVDVARGWRTRPGLDASSPAEGEAITLISPAPDDAADRIAGGTLVIVQRLAK